MRGWVAWSSATLLATVVACSACAGGSPARTPRSTSKPSPAAASSRKSFDFEHLVGLVEGDRKDSLWLCIADSTLSVGDSLTLLSDDPDPDKDTYVTVISAAVAERLPYSSNGPLPLYLAKMSSGGGRGVAGKGSGVDGAEGQRVDFFYRLIAPPGALDCCIFGYAVRAPRSAFRVASGRAEADLDGDGVMERFQSCASSEGLWPTVWSGEPFRGPRRWTHYYNLGYDLEPNCPGFDTPIVK